MKKTLLVVPLNDPEAMLISAIAEELGMDQYKSKQAHGARLDRIRSLPKRLKEGGYERVIIVEMPGVKTERKIIKAGIELVIIDHHHYTDLDRAHHPKTGKLLSSSLEQFLKLMRVGDSKLKKMGFDPKLVRAVGIMDRGYVWALKRKGYSARDIERVFAYLDELMGIKRNAREERAKNKLAKKVWKARTEWHGYEVVVSNETEGLRGRISKFIFEEVGMPLSLILEEKKRNVIYVQESEHSYELFEQFGGFTYGMDRNWGYKNGKGVKQVGLAEVKAFLETHHPKKH